MTIANFLENEKYRNSKRLEIERTISDKTKREEKLRELNYQLLSNAIAKSAKISRQRYPKNKPLPISLRKPRNRTIYNMPGLTLHQTNIMNNLVKNKTPNMRTKIARFHRLLSLYQLQELEWQIKKARIIKKLRELVRGTGLNSKLNNAIAN